ncbi:MAG: hypothetical protein GPOALKHO_000896 [Sodalis sp.]|nr:MAG: hypothetical protein GPOALKHO_000896 [Sodalis sp.]
MEWHRNRNPGKAITFPGGITTEYDDSIRTSDRPNRPHRAVVNAMIANVLKTSFHSGCVRSVISASRLPQALFDDQQKNAFVIVITAFIVTVTAGKLFQIVPWRASDVFHLNEGRSPLAGRRPPQARRHPALPVSSTGSAK